MKMVILLPLLSISASVELHLNVFRVQGSSLLQAKSFLIQETTLGQVAERIAEIIGTTSFIQCNSYCLRNNKCLGILYDEQQNCHLLNSTCGIALREQADDSGTVKVILYGVDVDGMVCDSSFQYMNNPAYVLEMNYWHMPWQVLVLAIVNWLGSCTPH